MAAVGEKSQAKGLRLATYRCPKDGGEYEVAVSIEAPADVECPKHGAGCRAVRVVEEPERNLSPQPLSPPGQEKGTFSDGVDRVDAVDGESEAPAAGMGVRRYQCLSTHQVFEKEVSLADPPSKVDCPWHRPCSAVLVAEPKIVGSDGVDGVDAVDGEEEAEGPGYSASEPERRVWPAVAMAVALTAYMRLTWKGQAPAGPEVLLDPETGTMWRGMCDWKQKIVLLEERPKFHARGEKPASTVHELPLSRFEKIRF